MEEGLSAEKYSTETVQPPGKSSRNGILICKPGCSGWSQANTHSGRMSATKGLSATFGGVCGAWKEQAPGEERWQVVVPRPLREIVLNVLSVPRETFCLKHPLGSAQERPLVVALPSVQHTKPCYFTTT